MVFNNINNKRGQITIFVILGLIVFVLVFIMFFVLRSDVKPDPEKEYVSEYDPLINPVVAGVEFCMNQLTEDALKKIGLQGGYLNVSDFRYDFSLSYLNNALEFFPGSNQVIPYWYYASSSPGSQEPVFELAVPSLTVGEESIKVQVENYVDSNILDCVNYFEDFNDDFEIVYLEPVSEVIFLDNEVLVDLFWDLNITFYSSDFEAFINKFTQTVDLDFKKTYDLAVNTLYESQFYSVEPFLEDYTLKVLELSSVGGKEAIIPPVSLYTDNEFSAPKMWNAYDAENFLKTELADNSGFLQLKDSYDSFIPLTNDPIDALVYSSFILSLDDFDENKIRNSRVSFDYMPIWPFFMDISPSYGPIVTASPKFEVSLMGLFNFALTDYQFFYDITYPVLVTIEDPSAFNGEGFVFRYVIEVNINKNNPFLTDVEYLNPEDYEFNSFDGFGYVEQRTIPLKVNIINGYDGSFVEDFNLGYACTDVTIPVGVSEIKNGVSVVEGFVPPCIGGKLYSLSNDYFAEVDLSVELNNSYELTLEAYPEKEIIVRPRKKMYNVNNVQINELEDHERRNWSLSLSGDNLIEENELLMLMFINKDVSSLVKFVNISYPDSEMSVGLFPGEYDVILLNQRVLADNEENPLLVVEEKTYDVSGGFFVDLFSGKENVTFNRTEFNDSIIIGGLFLEGNNSFKISVDDLRNNRYLNVPYPAYDFEKIEYHFDLEIMGKVFEIDEDQKEHFIPVFN